MLTAKNAHHAVGENHVDLVLTEHVAPARIDGPTLAVAMKTLKPEVPIAVYSADLE